jgi:DNA-directed RNA polymerase subunit RPC12/RpoP
MSHFTEDNYKCQFCKELIDEDYAESHINRRIICPHCKERLYVYITANQFLSFKQIPRFNKIRENKRANESVFRYLDKALARHLRREHKTVNNTLKKDFFTRHQLHWVDKIRRMIVFEAVCFQLKPGAIIEYFKMHGGKIDYRTIKKYKQQE